MFYGSAIQRRPGNRGGSKRLNPEGFSYALFSAGLFSAVTSLCFGALRRAIATRAEFHGATFHRGNVAQPARRSVHQLLKSRRGTSPAFQPPDRKSRRPTALARISRAFRGEDGTSRLFRSHAQGPLSALLRASLAGRRAPRSPCPPPGAFALAFCRPRIWPRGASD